MSIKRDILKDKLLDPKQYSTIYINKADEERATREQMDTLVELLMDDRHKAARTEVFNFMKKEKKAVDLLIRAINEAKENKSKLIAMCWEADVDCDRYLDFFTNLALSDDMNVAMEAITTLEHMRHITPEQANQQLEKAKEKMPKQMDGPREALFSDLEEILRKWQQ